MKVAIIGGTFDPIHQGHVAMARHVLKQKLADCVWFMVASDTPLKQHSISSFETRANMVALAIQPYAHMKVCTMEHERDGQSYTIDTVRVLKQRYPMHEFVWLIGNDQAMQLSAWKDIDELIKEITFYVFPRQHETIICAYPYVAMNTPLMDVSSSEIRIGKKRRCLAKAVRYYINEQGLYLREFAKHELSERRFLHSERVAEVCVSLAKCHGVDVQKAYAAGMLHDVCKEWDKTRLTVWMKQMEAQHMEEAIAIWHGYLGKHALSHQLYYVDKEVCDAIYHHVLGDGKSKLSMILYLSDKIEPGRGYDTSAQLALAKQDLKAAVELILSQQKAYLTKEKTQ